MAHNAAPLAGPSSALNWAVDANSPVGYNSRKALPIKRNDAEPLTREDVQFDLLDCIFRDAHAVFTGAGGARTTFAELYGAALYASSKCSKVLKEKMLETPAFATEFAKIALLTNVGRINTTMAFFPEMKTALRTYHPDAPRIKNCLKAVVLPAEAKSAPPSAPDEVLAKLRAGARPPTSVVNLIFVLANHAAPLASVHFDGCLNFLDLFLPRTRLASADRARAFLWLLYHYLEDAHGPSPFDDAHSRAHAGKAPAIRRLTAAERAAENVDTPAEVQWGRAMSAQRNAFLQKLVAAQAHADARPGGGGGGGTGRAAAPHFVTEGGNNLSRSQRQYHDAPRDEGAFVFYVPSAAQPGDGAPQASDARHDHPGHRSTASEGYGRSMFQQAWHMAAIDPLLDSDEETGDQDELEHSRVDYARRLGVISRILRRSTPPP
ncbi:hypothetical protein HYPSUDRAFT_199358 [Hypholoma sublateritium FD-334 SS-4]|uniref:Ino eighty subunit 1 n=1 Tax=Hypholoma sublateritium (strain FD-334 SS-4) TaxID=945553 RepID=A0A0D2PC77_HYPSF|nr:hypothetical protein HYPSUDRAFT_199358 [Hypholoma sublateritium FD-334 SS-4]